MRIRKNAKLFGGVEMELSEGSRTPLEVHHCQLNRSPWDLPGDGDDCFAVNGSFGDSIGTTHSFPSAELMDVSFDYGSKLERQTEEETEYIGGQTGSHCRLEAKSEHSTALYDHINTHPHSPAAPTTQPRHRRGRPRKNPATTVGLNDFYYYSGFGPQQWSRAVSASEVLLAEGYTNKIAAGEEVGSDYIDDDDKEEREKVGRRQRRGRKPIKARSLKSLM